MKKINGLLAIILLVGNVVTMQAMLTRGARKVGYKKGIPKEGIFAKSSNSSVNISSAGPFGPQGQIRSYSEGWRPGEEPYFAPEFKDWKDYAKPFKRSFTSYIPFTQAYADYQKKNKDLAQLRHMVDKWQLLICQKYDSPQSKTAALDELRREMESFKLQYIPNYKKEVLVYIVALLNHCLAWREENKIFDNHALLELLLRYVNHIYTGRLISDIANITDEYPFFRTAAKRAQKFEEEMNRQQYEQQQEQYYQEEHYRQRQQQGQQQARQGQSSFVKGLQTKKILGLPENASDDQVKVARNKFLLKNHPDITKNLVKQGKMTQVEVNRRNNAVVELNRAYEREYERSRE